jgi:hypothetical protein
MEYVFQALQQNVPFATEIVRNVGDPKYVAGNSILLLGSISSCYEDILYSTSAQCRLQLIEPAHRSVTADIVPCLYRT